MSFGILTLFSCKLAGKKILRISKFVKDDIINIWTLNEILPTKMVK